MESDASRFIELFDDIPLALFIRGSGGRVEWMNCAALDLLDADRDTAVGRPCREALGCRYCGPDCAAYRTTKDGETRTGFPVAVERADGAKRLLLIDTIPLKRGRVAVVMHDVSDLRSCEPLVESSQICFRFLVHAMSEAG